MRRLFFCATVLLALLALTSGSSLAQKIGGPTILSVEPNYTERTMLITGSGFGKFEPVATLFDADSGVIELEVLDYDTDHDGMQTLLVGLPDECIYMSGMFKLTVARKFGAIGRGGIGRGASHSQGPADTVDFALYPDVERAGSIAETKLYEVHRRVLWDAAWLKPEELNSQGFWVYNDEPRRLTYGAHSLFLSPLQGYGVPEPATGAARTVRLYVNYGHQWMCEGTPTIVIGPLEGGATFELPMISGHYGAQGANWSSFVDYDELLFGGHKEIWVYLDDFVDTGAHCWGSGSTMGAMFRVEAVFYDKFVPEALEP